MRCSIPTILVDALADGSWKNVSPDVLRRCLGDDLDDLQLYGNTDVMVRLSANLEEGGYVDDPQFCMTREKESVSDDPRLKFHSALFIGGSVIPGDDVFVAIELQDAAEYDPSVLVFDWRMKAPHRWSVRGKLSELIRGVKSLSSNPCR